MEVVSRQMLFISMEIGNIKKHLKLEELSVGPWNDPIEWFYRKGTGKGGAPPCPGIGGAIWLSHEMQN